MTSVCEAKDITEKKIAITFDDGPDPLHTPAVLKLLEEYNLKASFFIIGKKINGQEGLLKDMYEKGHLLGNHSFSHSYVFDFYPTVRVQKELEETNRLIEQITGKKTMLFRPPYGVTNPNIARAVENLKLLSIGWNLRSLDTVIRDREALYKRVIAGIRPGSILLFHDTNENTVEALKEIIQFSKENGYRIVGLDDLLNIKAYA